MAETEYRHLIQSAQDRALFGFLALVQRAIQDADKNLVQMLSEAKSGINQSALMSVRHFLHQDGNVFLRRVDTLFRNYLDRAMQTMFVDLRPGMRKLSANELSLIDDEVVNHQIEVGRLAERMRDANEESIGRLNVIVAQMHGQREARERENPFRPYLLARALYEAIKEVATDEPKAKVLFEHLSNALIQHLPGYYSGIREVFESSGMRGSFVAQRSRAAHNQRYFGAPLDQHGLPAHLSSRLMPGLQRVLEILQNTNASAAGENGQPATLQDFIRKMFCPSKPLILGEGDTGKGRLLVRATKEDLLALTANPLAAQLHQYQKMAAQGQSVNENVPLEKNQLTALREQIDLGKASVMERMTVDVVAMLFEFILEDKQIPVRLRQLIGRLQIPILKAAVLEPELMHDEDHPARQLLNRMSSAAIAADAATQGGQKLVAEIERIVRKILAEFHADTSIFASNLKEFGQFLAEYLRQGDSQTTRGIDAVEAAEKFSVLLNNATNSLCDVLLPLSIDKGVSDFIIRVWPHVLVHAAWYDGEKRITPKQPESLFRQYRAVLPELLWSIQEKQGAEERSALIRLLPDLVKRLRSALQLIQLPEEECKQLLDQLVDMHTQILRGSQKGAGKELPSLEELRQNFARVAIGWERASWGLSEPPQPRAALIEEVFAKYNVNAELNLGISTIATSQADREFLTQAYLLGTRVEFRAADEVSVSGQLVWVSTHRSLYLFKQDGNASLMLYTFASLLEALRDEAIVPVEYAPVFERAMESLLFGAGSIQAASA